MHQILQNLQPFQDNVVRGLAVDVGHETDAAGIALVGGVVKTLSRG